MIRESITFSFEDEAQRARFHARLKGDDFAEARTVVATKTFTARDVLTFLFAECAKWEEDVDGEWDSDGRQRGYSYHTVEFKGGLLEELLDMAGIVHIYESPLEALARANKEDSGLPEPAKAPEPEIIF